MVSSLLWREMLFSFSEAYPTFAAGACPGTSEAADFFSGIISLVPPALGPELFECSVTVETLLSSTFYKEVLPTNEAWPT
jgi:hypothetical protein